MFKVFTNTTAALVAATTLVVLALSGIAVISFDTVANANTKKFGLPGARYVEGTHYTLIDPPRKVADVPAGKVAVEEFFWYGCPHCYTLEPYLSRWKKPKDVFYLRHPAILGSSWQAHARIYFALAALGKIDGLHSEFFKALHTKRSKMRSDKDIFNFFAEHGVKQATLEKAMDSFLVDAKVKQARKLAAEYKLSSVPTLVVAGRYMLSPSTAGGYEKVVPLIEYLVEKQP